MGEQQRQTPAERLFWNDPTQPTLPPEGMMPGQPGGTGAGPADAAVPLPALPPADLPPPGAAAAPPERCARRTPGA